MAIYYPHPEDDEVLRISDNQPCRASILNVSEDGRLADLLVTDHLGGEHCRPCVPIGPLGFPTDYCLLV